MLFFSGFEYWSSSTIPTSEPGSTLLADTSQRFLFRLDG